MVFALVGKKIASGYYKNLAVYGEYVGFLREYLIAVDITKRTKNEVLEEFDVLKKAMEDGDFKDENVAKAIAFLKNLGKDSTETESKSVKAEIARGESNLALFEQEAKKKSKCAVLLSIAVGLVIVILII